MCFRIQPYFLHCRRINVGVGLPHYFFLGGRKVPGYADIKSFVPSTSEQLQPRLLQFLFRYQNTLLHFNFDLSASSALSLISTSPPPLQPTTKKTIKMPTLYETTIPVFIRQLNILSKILERGVAHAKDSANAVTEQSLVDARLISDMQTLAYQIQRVSDTSKGFAVRVAKIEPVPFEDNEKTFPELQERIAKTIKFLESVKVSYSLVKARKGRKRGER